MHRRTFLSILPATAAALAAPTAPPGQDDRAERLTAGPSPALAINHLGFLPQARKTVIYRVSGPGAPAEFTLRDIGSQPKPPALTRPLTRGASDLGECLVGDFSDITRPGMYQIAAGAELSVPFFIRAGVWRRTLPKAIAYIHAQRCGAAVPNVHPACHLDDARRRDNGRHIDTTGGWHDAGDLRKWMSATMLNGLALLSLARNLGQKWDPAGAGLAPLLDEARWGNRYFLKMQDRDGLVWNDVAGGVNGDNTDNHWTDNVSGTADDRYLNPAKPNRVQSLFTTLQAMMAQAFHASDPTYSATCLTAALRCWNAATRFGSTGDLASWALAALELHRATARHEFRDFAVNFGLQLASLQQTEFTGDQKKVRGWWRASGNNPAPYADPVHSTLPAIALLELAAAYPRAPEAAAWRDAVRLHLDEYALPLAARSAYRIVPYGIFTGSPTPELYRPLAGQLTYRYFMPVRKQDWWLGMTSHLAGYAVLAALAWRAFDLPDFRHLAYRQLEWIMGANPFGACLMTGEGMRNPYPHSRFVGLIPGGIMNGIAGNLRDEPILDTLNGFDWRTTEYWSPHNAHYIWALSILENA
jgi:hypothetical protein